MSYDQIERRKSPISRLIWRICHAIRRSVVYVTVRAVTLSAGVNLAFNDINCQITCLWSDDDFARVIKVYGTGAYVQVPTRGHTMYSQQSGLCVGRPWYTGLRHFRNKSSSEVDYDHLMCCSEEISFVGHLHVTWAAWCCVHVRAHLAWLLVSYTGVTSSINRNPGFACVNITLHDVTKVASQIHYFMY